MHKPVCISPMFRLTAAAITLTILGVACQSSTTEQPFDTLSAEQKVRAYQLITLGSPYDSLKQQFPGLSDQQFEGKSNVLGRQGLTEASVPVQFDQGEITLELNFRNDSLYSYFFTADQLNRQQADSLSAHILEILEQDFQQPETEEHDEGSYKAVNRFWHTETLDVALTISSTSDQYQVSWGYQQ